MASMTSCVQTTTLNEYEERITIILDTLKNDYYWQHIPSDFMGRILPNYDYNAERKKYSFRVARDNYWQELDSLLEKKLSETFLINLLNEEHKRGLAHYFHKVTDKLFSCQSDSAYAALYHFVAVNPEYYQIALELVKNNRHKDEIRNCILQIPADNYNSVGYISSYLRLFDEETDKLILAKVYQYVRDNLDKETMAANWRASVIARYYFPDYDADELHKQFDNWQTKHYRAIMDKCIYTNETFKKAQENWWRTWAENVLRYYEKQK